jgi:hypothetical protein
VAEILVPDPPIVVQESTSFVPFSILIMQNPDAFRKALFGNLTSKPATWPLGTVMCGTALLAALSTPFMPPSPQARQVEKPQ